MPDFSPPPPPPLRSGRLKTVGLVGAGLAVVIVAGGVIMRARANQDLKSWTDEQTVATVSLAKLKGGGKAKLVMPAEVQAFYTAPIYARTSGYLKRWYAE